MDQKQMLKCILNSGPEQLKKAEAIYRITLQRPDVHWICELNSKVAIAAGIEVKPAFPLSGVSSIIIEKNHFVLE
jgi:hypothetical protein